MYGFCFVAPLMGANRPNTGKDNDDVKITYLFMFLESKVFSLLPTSNKFNVKTTIFSWHHCTIQIIFNMQGSKKLKFIMYSSFIGLENREYGGGAPLH
jgi:hypothetical protein